MILAGAISQAASPEPQRFTQAGFTMEIRYEPIPGVPLAKAKTGPVVRLTASDAWAGCPIQVGTVQQDCPEVRPAGFSTEAARTARFAERPGGEGLPNLVFYTPTGWDYPLVPSNVRGTHTVGPDLNDLDTTFIDWAVVNLGNGPARPRFYTYLYLDQVPIAGWSADSLPPLYYIYVEDHPEMISQGNHRLGVFTDSTNAVAESSETNNRFEREFTWRHWVGVAAGPEAERFWLRLGANPVLGRVAVDYQLPGPEMVRLAVYDKSGARVALLAQGEMPAGRHRVFLADGLLAQGAYFLVLETARGQRQVVTFVKL